MRGKIDTEDPHLHHENRPTKVISEIRLMSRSQEDDGDDDHDDDDDGGGSCVGCSLLVCNSECAVGNINFGL